MIQVYENLWQGSANDFEEHGHEFDAVLCIIAGETDIHLDWNAPRFYLHLKSPDGNGFDELIMQMAMDFLLNTHGKGYKTFIHCFAGRSRSVAITACYVAALNGLSIDNVIKNIYKLKEESGEKNIFGIISPSQSVYKVAKNYLKENGDAIVMVYYSQAMAAERKKPKVKNNKVLMFPKPDKSDELEFGEESDALLEELFGKPVKTSDQKTMGKLIKEMYDKKGVMK